ncbi:OLC1v1036552C1 [Oldenlandia corymbosa var. corymbosa]|uniref:OLC1v1036552C1 n=1 Tax=Oldenlandia corymbosa var. corymbosa TaxID=529605 RepID=A0AAV1CX38_OLDCO|nr:OLC1v1036552C1 [Oldenlandia corymbosa var. corymbosa]
MGCSASRSEAFVSRDQKQNQIQSSNFSSSSLSQSPYSSFSSSTPVSRTLSFGTPLVHHPPIRKGDTNHLVSLTSTTYGSLILIDTPKPNFDRQDFVNSTAQIVKPQNMGDSGDPLSPDSVINTWELMEGLDELDFEVIESPTLKSPKRTKSKTFDNGLKKDLDGSELEKGYEFVEHSDSKPLWQHLSEESLLAKLDPNVVSSYQRALLSKQSGVKEVKQWSQPEKIEPLESPPPPKYSSFRPKSDAYLSGGENKVVLYYTSLRGIRKTYEDCCFVRMIFRGFNVCVDERDISMDSSYRKELQGMLGVAAVPQVFIKGMHIGGAEEVGLLHDGGELAQLLEGIPVKDSGFVCESCGDARFLPCPNCNGSRKIFEEDEGKLRRCPDCNENGLVRCPSCCS